MLMVFSQPFFRQRQAVQAVTPICSSHLERLMMATVAEVEFLAGVFIRERQFVVGAGLNRSGSFSRRCPPDRQ